MKLAYTYQTKHSPLSPLGVVLAINRSHAEQLLKSQGIEVYKLVFSVKYTLWHRQPTPFPKSILANVYRNIGSHVDTLSGILEGIELSKRCSKNLHLRHALNVMQQYILSGESISKSMQNAQFSIQDSLMVEAASRAGKLKEVLIQISKNAKKAGELELEMRRTLQKTYYSLMATWGFLYIIVTWICPRISQTIQQLEIQTTSFSTFLFYWIHQANQNPKITLFIWISLPIFLRFSQKNLYENYLLHLWPTLKKLALTKDLLLGWSGFQLTLETQVPLSQCACVARMNCQTEQIRKKFICLENFITAGIYLDEATSLSGFSSEICHTVHSACANGETAAQLEELVQTLSQKEQHLQKSLLEETKVMNLFLMATAIFIIFMTSYYPLISSTLQYV